VIDYEKLMAYEIPDVRQSYGAREVAFYGLSIGIGQDPMDANQLRHVGAAPEVFPTMPLVLGHPGFWLGNPATGVDASRLVHGEQSLVISAPLPPEGSVIGRTRVTRIVDKGLGKGALLDADKELVDAQTGGLYATTRMTVFLRGDGGFGGPSGIAQRPRAMPERAPDLCHEQSTRPEQALWYRWNGDGNPLHFDPAVAKASGFERPIMHGLCSFAIAAQAVVAGLCGARPDRLRALKARFTAAVVPGERLRTEMWHDGSFRTVAVERGVMVIGNGYAEVG